MVTKFYNFDVNSISENSPIGHILEVDLEYPNELHVLHHDYPLAPEKLAISHDILSDYSKKIVDKYGIKVGDVKKLVPNLGNKTYYVVHYKNRQLYLSLGIKLIKIHRALKFKQSDWMKIYIDFNTKQGTNASNSFEKIFLKLMINSVYEKWKITKITMENLRKIIYVKLVNNEKHFLKDTREPTHITHEIFDKNYAAIHRIQSVLTINKPIYVGLTVLELSRWLMYDFHYNFIKKKFDAELLFITQTVLLMK